MTQEKATAPETEQPPPPTPEKEELKAEDVQATEAGAEDRMKGMETQLQELQQGLAAKDIQHRAELERLRLEGKSETDRRVTQAVQTTKTELASQTREVETAQLEQKALEGDEAAVRQLRKLATEPLEQAREAEKAEKYLAEGRTSGYIESLADSMNRRLGRLEPTDERRGEFTVLWNAGKFEDLEAEMAKDETVKAGGTSTERMAEIEKQLTALQKGNQAASEEETAMKEREDAGADLGGGTPSGGKKYAQLTPEERQGMSSGDIDAMLARERGEK